MSFRTRVSRIALLDRVLELMTHDSRLMTFHAGQVFALREDLLGVELSERPVILSAPMQMRYQSSDLNYSFVVSDNGFKSASKIELQTVGNNETQNGIELVVAPPISENHAPLRYYMAFACPFYPPHLRSTAWPAQDGRMPNRTRSGRRLRRHDPEKLRRLVRRREIEGLSYAQLAKETGIPVGTLAWWTQRLRQEKEEATSRSAFRAQRGRRRQRWLFG
jgi:hypothetical protein